MSNKNDDKYLEKILDISRQVALAIEDNNQNMRDCYRVLVELQKIINPKKPSWFKRKILRLINRKE